MGKIKAVFINKGENNNKQAQISLVYSPKTRTALSERLDISEEVYSQADLGAPIPAQAVIAFSTWGMPELTEDEISRYLPRLKILFYAAGSVQDFARPFLRRGVRVVSAWGPTPCRWRNIPSRKSYWPIKVTFFQRDCLRNRGIGKPAISPPKNSPGHSAVRLAL